MKLFFYDKLLHIFLLIASPAYARKFHFAAKQLRIAYIDYVKKTSRENRKPDSVADVGAQSFI